MKKIILLLPFVFLINTFYSQVIVKITQSPNNPLLLGVIPSIWADPSVTGWSTPDMTNATNAIEAELMFVDDATDTTIDVNGNPTWQDACEPVINDITGKIAVVYRSFCWHDIKANYAQQAGAIGVIIINRDPGPFAMGGSTVGSSVTIPVVSIGSEEGDELRDFIAMGGVRAFIGTKVGLNVNDLGSSPANIVMAHHTSIPSFLSTNGTENALDLGMFIFNPGSNAQVGVTASVDINYNGSSVFSNSSIPLSFNAPVGVVVDTIYADLGVFSPSSWAAGEYNIRYQINLTNDEDTSDNVFESRFSISPNIYAKSRIDSLYQPLKSTAYSLNESTTLYDDWESCLVFKDANASRGIVQGMTFSCAPVNGAMSFEIIEIRAYEWNDVFADLSVSTPTFNALNQVGDAFYFYPDETENGVNIFLPFDAPFQLVDNQKYLFCVYNSSDELRIGYDVQLDYESTVNNYLQPIAPVKVLPNGQSPIWYWAGFGYDATPSISVTIDMITNVDGDNNMVVENTIPYPNPAKNLITIPVRKQIKGLVNIEIFDMLGKVVASENNHLENGPIKINVASIPNGTYMVKLVFEDNSSDSFKIAINR